MDVDIHSKLYRMSTKQTYYSKKFRPKQNKHFQNMLHISTTEYQWIQKDL